MSGLIVMFTQKYLHFSGLENAMSADIIEAMRTPPFDFSQLLVAGMLMGVLGVAVDGAIEVSSSMEEIRRANPNMPTWRLVASGMNVGTDILGTMVNTLVFAYLGARLLLIMAIAAPNVDLFQSPPVELLSVGVVAAEIVRLLAGTLGLVLAIPITALLPPFGIQGLRSSALRSVPYKELKHRAIASIILSNRLTMKVTMMAVFGFIGFAPYSASGDLRQVGRVSDASSELRTNFGL